VLFSSAKETLNKLLLLQHTFSSIWILYPSARASKILKPIQLTPKEDLRYAFPQGSQEFTIMSKTSHKSKCHT